MNPPVLQYENPRNRRRWTWDESAAVAGVVAVLVLIVGITRPWPRPYKRVQSRRSQLIGLVQSLRSQVALFKLQHNDRLPGVCPLVESGGSPAANEAVLWNQLTRFTDVDGNTSPTKTATHVYGPYMQSLPTNPLNGSRKVAATAAPGVGFVYDYAGGAGSGKVWGVDADGNPIPQ